MAQKECHTTTVRVLIVTDVRKRRKKGKDFCLELVTASAVIFISAFVLFSKILTLASETTLITDLFICLFIHLLSLPPCSWLLFCLQLLLAKAADRGHFNF